MTKHRHHNKHLTSEEVALLKAWVWEEAHREKEGPAHQLFREHGIDLGYPLALIHAAELELPDVEVGGDRPLPTGWPWGEEPLAEIVEELKRRRTTLKDVPVTPGAPK